MDSICFYCTAIIVCVKLNLSFTLPTLYLSNNCLLLAAIEIEYPSKTVITLLNNLINKSVCKVFVQAIGRKAQY